jgi:hypothetical protein
MTENHKDGWVIFGSAQSHYYRDGLALCDKRRQPPEVAHEYTTAIKCAACYGIRDGVWFDSAAAPEDVRDALRQLARLMDDAAGRDVDAPEVESRRRAAAQTRFVALMVGAVMTAPNPIDHPHATDLEGVHPEDWLAAGYIQVTAWNRQDDDAVHASRSARRARIEARREQVSNDHRKAV